MKFRTSDGKEYNLEYTRASVRYGEAIGFKIETFDNKIFTNTEDLFYIGFLKNHADVTKEETYRILYEELGGLKAEEVSDLVTAYMEPYSTLINTDGEPDENGKVKNVRRATIL